MPSLSSFGAVENPLQPFSTMNAVMPRAPGGGIGLRVDDQHVGVGPVGDPHLGAVQHVAVAALLRAQLHAHDVRAGGMLAHRERADVLAGHERGQIAPLLRGGAVAPDLVHAEIGVRAVGEPDRGRSAAHFLHRDHVGEVAHAGAAVLLLDGDAEQAQIAQLRPQVARKLVVAVDTRPRAARSLRPAKSATVARRISRVSPSSKSSPGYMSGN